jgi:hypothetical protein
LPKKVGVDVAAFREIFSEAETVIVEPVRLERPTRIGDGVP